MGREKVDDACWALSVSIVVFVVVISFCVSCTVAADDPFIDNPAASEIFSQLVSQSLTNLSSSFKSVTKDFAFCITDSDADWNEAFNFSKDTTFLSNCIRSKGDLTKRLCTAAEIQLYFSSLSGAATAGKRTTIVKPNKNCNLTSWVAGCEPGWACSVPGDEKVDLKTRVLPLRIEECSACCEGFFCPNGLTCMIPCPLGSYCPLAKLNQTTGLCDPYNYQIPPGQTNHTCGAADIWADIQSSSEVFCSAGSYCPSTIRKNPCSSGHYCRLGSTSEKACFRLASCESKSANQNITAYGIMLFVGLSILVVVIYSCSDQVLTTREKRIAKSREKAVQSVRESAQASETWKSAKSFAKRGAIGLQTQLSRTFSKRKPSRIPGPRGSSQAIPGTDGSLPPLPPGASSSSQFEPKGKKKETSNLTKMINEIDKNPESQHGFNIEIGNQNIIKNAPKGKQLHTQSQMFRYAYNQIEREKAMQEQNKNLTFSGLITMANDIDIRKRPAIEVAFKDLTITLKGKNKNLMRCVTGKLSPGRVSAVMGPSGAGKTTFLSALTGKVPGCTMSGMVLVNQKVESIRSYKKIIGFVPQDDIVHGNLTVEENLWFSARCRLAADLPKPEKVLVVERVIESLGLQAIRDSLVGTVEKRGISGGQRKRVNVGLEMVMEPSLLILDEPTSGLDSSSSQLLLRALRHEALEAVNICMVVHQPSYTLFKMFDDLILLAKGGLTVYHGPVKKVEEYFAGLGITVPERANPPDYYIDILEGIIKPSASSGVNAKQLPVRWMLHNGYQVPMDMIESFEGMKASTSEDNGDGTDEQSLAGDLWADVKCNVEVTKDSIRHNFLSSGDLSDRRTPGVFQQYRYFLGRAGKQRLREAWTQSVDYLILLLAGICLGTLAKVSDETFGSQGYIYSVIAMCKYIYIYIFFFFKFLDMYITLLCSIAALRSFSLDKLHYWRESGSGMSSLAYFLSKDTVDLFNILIKPLVYLSMFYFFNNPRSSVYDNYFVLVCLVYCVTGLSYIVAICFEPGPAQLWSVLLPVVLTLVATHNNNNEVVDFISELCYTKWALEAFVVSNAKRYFGVWLITRCGSLQGSGYDLKHFVPNLIKLVATGIVARAIAYICMITLQKK
ncbi:hypothetical protein EZV62_002401 [Acer yangbiense]|uniref:ABC transporter domain-containing protein n=1 Tax=Acer yangbiense TaxID=1000413 RepID=A0A5C7IYY8_9ROSI|nr:hypothetical protein EZV62_002401 [Acer yangbiense]